MMPETVVVRTGVANQASVLAALARLGVEAEVTEDANRVSEALRVVLPGVGAFGAGMAALARSGLVQPLRERLAARRPTLAICLGFQLLLDGSDESPGTDGLGIVPGAAARFRAARWVPQLGWNRVTAADGARYLEDGYAYFANSYRLQERPRRWKAAMADSGESFVAAVEDGGVLACQFHPELSGAWGESLLRRWVRATGSD